MLGFDGPSTCGSDQPCRLSSKQSEQSHVSFDSVPASLLAHASRVNENEEFTSNFNHGGNFAWSDVHYKMKIAIGVSPLQFLNKLAKQLLVLGDVVLATDGTFRRPSDRSLLFPVGGIDLRWRYDSQQQRIIIEFLRDGKMLKWRWDELKPKAGLAVTQPDLIGIGHVGMFTFKYKLLCQAGTSDEPLSLLHKEEDTLLYRLEPVPMYEDDLFSADMFSESLAMWKAILAEASKCSLEKMGSVFAQPPLDAIIGEGAYGVVWLAKDCETGDRYAVKNMVVRRSFDIRCAVAENEFAFVRKMLMKPHPHIANVFSLECISLPRAELFMVIMEFCEGGDMQVVLNNCVDENSKRYIPPLEADLWIGQIFLAVEHIHTNLNLLIRDLKPSNVLLTGERRAKLTDFGCGRLVADSPGDWSFAVPPGSPGYAAPELLAQEPYSYPIDIYSLGAIIWVISSGGTPEKYFPSPPINGNLSDFSSFQSDWKVLKAALEKPEMGRCPIDVVTTEVVDAMTHVSHWDRPDCKGLRDFAFFRDRVLPCIEDVARSNGREVVQSNSSESDLLSDI